LAVERAAIRVGRPFELALALQNLAEVVVGLRIQGIDGDRAPVRLGRKVPLLLQPSRTP
jgi:hypothetical protein